MEDSLDKALRKRIPATESSLIKEAINKGCDITLKHGMIRGNIVTLNWSVWDKLTVWSWVISDSD